MTTAQDSNIEQTFHINLVGSVKMFYSKSLATFEGEIQGVPGTRKFRIWYPVSDRRVARRISRKEKLKFRKHGRYFEFK